MSSVEVKTEFVLGNHAPGLGPILLLFTFTTEEVLGEYAVNRHDVGFDLNRKKGYLNRDFDW